MSMVIGNGIIANRFIDYALQSRYLIFVGNVHDSTTCDEIAIRNEEEGLKNALLNNQSSVFVYFSQCSILDPNKANSLYVMHKFRMEKLIQNSPNEYHIFRLPQLFGLSNEKTSLVNYLVDAIVEGRSFDLWRNVEKNLIDIDDVHLIVDYILTKKIYSNRIINIASPYNTPILELVQCMESYFGHNAKYSAVDKGTSYKIDISETLEIITKLNINFKQGYILKAINKYFRHLINKPLLLSVIVPTYNEEHGIEEFYRRTKVVLKTLEPRFDHEIIFVNDFSTDNTYNKLQALAEIDHNIKLINFSRNFGYQIAITAGIDFSRGDVAVIIDDDLEDPPEVMLNFIAMWSAGFKVVYGVRPKRQGVNVFFKLLAKIYYRLINILSETKIPNDTGDFRLIDRLVIDKLKLMREGNRYYRGMVAWVGFSQIGCTYERDKRYAGKSTFSFKKYINFALQGLTSFTDKPLYFASLLGFLIAGIGFLYAIRLVISKIIDPSFAISGWTSLVVIVLFLGGMQLLSIGIIGIYIGKIYQEVKGRPLYIIDKTTNLNE
ncbi:MAG: glycosyltransferase [Ignavibacteriales bacterium]|nr:glycosyltransferase [Ignavibacteriales bacterium]